MPTDRQPIGFRAWTAIAADFAGQPLHIRSEAFGAEAEARAWAEKARAIAPDPGNFACTVEAVYGDPF